jgi:type II secretory pathway pseudopilin PulG
MVKKIRHRLEGEKTDQTGEDGYTLALFVMVIAVMAIMAGAAVQLASFQMKREKEAELIFRGQQYVEGIRLYRQKYGRYPVRMKELWEAEPKVLRKKWIDPMTGSEKWGVIFEGQEGQELQVPGVDRRATPTRTPIFERDREGEGEKVGPIVGVHSLSTEESIKIYEGRNRYNMWKFVLKEEPPVTQDRRRDDEDRRDTTRTPSYRQTRTPNY